MTGDVNGLVKGGEYVLEKEGRSDVINEYEWTDPTAAAAALCHLFGWIYKVRSTGCHSCRVGCQLVQDVILVLVRRNGSSH